MKYDEFNKIDAYLKSNIKRIPQEEPGDVFVGNVMFQVHELEHRKPSIYQPIIPIKVWIMMGFVFTSLLVAAFFTSGQFDYSRFNQAFNNFIDKYFSYIINPVFITGILIFIFYFIVEIFIIRKRIEKLEM